MDSDFFPVVIRCQEVSVAIPISVLIQESTVFSALYKSCQNSPCDSGRSSGLSDSNFCLQETQLFVLGCVEEVVKEDCDQPDDVLLRANEVSQPDDNHKVAYEPLQNSANKGWNTNDQIDTIDLNAYNPNSVWILFNYLKGHPELIASCINLQDLFGILQLCDQYSIKKPVKDILNRIKTCDTISADNLIEAMDIVQNIGCMKNYDDIAEILFQRCVTYARNNYASWQVIMKQMIANKTKVHNLVRILKELQDGDEAVVRFRIERFSKKTSSSLISSPFIVKNLEWKLEIILPHPEDDGNEVDIVIHCNNPTQKKDWYCKIKLQLKIIHHKSEEENCSHQKILVNEFDKFQQSNTQIEIQSIISLQDVLDYDLGYIKNDTVLLELKIEIEALDGLPTSLGLSEFDVGWYNKFNQVSTIQRKSEESEELVDDDCAVIFTCENVIVAIHQSCLIRESPVFRAMYCGSFVEGKTGDNDFKHVKLTGYLPLAIKSIIDFLQGHTSMMNDCQDIKLLADMLCFCDFYGISSPQEELIKKILNLFFGMENVVDFFTAAQKLGIIESYGKLSSNLISRCVTFLRYNLSHWNILINFIVYNSDNMDAVMKILEELAEENVANIRVKIDRLGEKLLTEHYTEVFIHQNLSWKILFKFGTDEPEFVDFYLYHSGSDENLDTWSCKVSQKMKVHQTSDWKNFHLKESESFSFTKRNTNWGEDGLIRIETVLDKNNGYVKDDSVCFELEIVAENPTGIPTDLGNTEQIKL